jgi:hypothetical protein
MISTLFLYNCSSSKPKNEVEIHNDTELHSFTPVKISIEKIDAKEYSEFLEIMNKEYPGDAGLHVRVEHLNSTPAFVYLHVFPKGDNQGCYRVTVDKKRQSIVNVQPDCIIEDE